MQTALPLLRNGDLPSLSRMCLATVQVKLGSWLAGGCLLRCCANIEHTNQ